MRSSNLSGRSNYLPRVMLPLVLAACVGAPAYADEAMQWVQKMSDAMRGLSYSGTFVYMHDNQLESMQISHYRDSDGEKEHLLSLNGEAREVIRDNQNLTCIWPSSRKVVVDLSRKNSFSPIFIPDDIARLEKFYDIRLLGMDRVANQNTVVVYIEPRDIYRYGIKFWINRNNHLMMKSSLLDEQKREIEQVMFTNLQVYDSNEKPVIDTMPKIDESFTLVRYHRGDSSESVEFDNAWQLSRTPGGFWRESALRRTVPGTGDFVQQLVYTDGLASLSVFIERKTSESLSGATSMGAVNGYMRIHANHSITAIGEVPAITVKEVAESITYRQQ